WAWPTPNWVWLLFQGSPPAVLNRKLTTRGCLSKKRIELGLVFWPRRDLIRKAPHRSLASWQKSIVTHRCPQKCYSPTRFQNHGSQTLELALTNYRVQLTLMRANFGSRKCESSRVTLSA